MTISEKLSWENQNRNYLLGCIDEVKNLLRAHIKKNSSDDNNDNAVDTRNNKNKGDATAIFTESENKTYPSLHKTLWEGQPSQRPAIDYLSELFGLSNFERLVLILCASIELDSDVAQLCARAQGMRSAEYPTFSLALAAFPGAHWSAIAPVSPLRLFKLVDLYGHAQTPITKCRLGIEERVLHFLAGVSYLDKSLQGSIKQIRFDKSISPSQKLIGSAIVHAWKNGHTPFHVQLVGSDDQSKQVVANWVCRELGMTLWQTQSEVIPQQQLEVEQMALVWNRESMLMNSGLYISAIDVEPTSHKIIKRFMENISGPIFLSTNDPIRVSDFMLSFEINKPTKGEQRDIWRIILEKNMPAENKSLNIEEEIMRVINQFNLNTLSIQVAATNAILEMKRGGRLHDVLWSACRKVAHPRLLDLAQKIASRASMDDLILPEKEKNLLRSIIANVRQRYHVYEEWGFGDDNNNQRGLGITVLFSGDSGTGKTMAAEVMARELGLDLFRIDLSMVVSKYIGETEKNLRKIFDAAEDGGAILLFDEADSLFGKRSEVKDSHDRYANIEVGYLLQRMESYKGLAILTTNMKDALDKAFLRRIRFAVNFPFPNEKSRKEIWKRVFPKSVPLDAINYDSLAQLDVVGGHIRNIALGAAMTAADEGTPVRMSHIAKAAREEYNKMERPLTNARWTD